MMFRFQFGLGDLMYSTPRATLEEMYPELYGAKEFGIPVDHIEMLVDGDWVRFDGADNVITIHPSHKKEETNGSVS